MKTKTQQPTRHRGTREVLTELLTNVGEKGDGVSPLPLTIRVKFVKLIPLLTIAPSSNGKTADSGSAYRGSNPCGAAQYPATYWFLRPYRLTVRTEPSQGSNTGSIPVKATRRKDSVLLARIPAHLARFFAPSIPQVHAPVAQLDRASDYESEGWGFDSLRVHQHSSTSHIYYTTPCSLIKKMDKGQLLL